MISPQIERELIELLEKLRGKLSPIQIMEFKKLIHILFLIERIIPIWNYV